MGDKAMFYLIIGWFVVVTSGVVIIGFVVGANWIHEREQAEAVISSGKISP